MRDSLRQWLCHFDARQVSDLPAANLLFIRVFDHHGQRPFRLMGYVSASLRLAAHQSGRAIAAVASKFDRSPREIKYVATAGTQNNHDLPAKTPLPADGSQVRRAASRGRQLAIRAEVGR